MTRHVPWALALIVEVQGGSAPVTRTITMGAEAARVVVGDDTTNMGITVQFQPDLCYAFRGRHSRDRHHASLIGFAPGRVRKDTWVHIGNGS